MYVRVFTGQFFRAVLSPVFWLCTVLFSAVLLINSGIAFADPTSDVISAYTLSVLNSEPVAMSILPALPFALSYMEERKERSLRLAYIRCGVYEYISAKYASVVFSGFCVAAVGCIWYFCVLSAFMPFAERSLAIRESVGLNLLLEHGRPLVYLICVTFCQCASAAVFTAMTFVASMTVKGKYTAMVMPYLFYVMLTLFDALFNLNLNLRRVFLDMPIGYTPFGQVTKKLVFVLSALAVLWLVAVRKGEGDILND